MVVCSPEPAAKYALGPARIVGGVVDAEAMVPEGQTTWVVDFQLDAEGTEEFARISQELVGTEGQMAIVLDGVVVSAPTMQSVIPNGEVQIYGNLTEDQATELADRLESPTG